MPFPWVRATHGPSSCQHGQFVFSTDESLERIPTSTDRHEQSVVRAELVASGTTAIACRSSVLSFRFKDLLLSPTQAEYSGCAFMIIKTGGRVIVEIESAT